MDPATKAQVADILTGILKNLQGHKALTQTAQKVQKVSPPSNVAHAMQSLLSTVRTSVKKQPQLDRALTSLLTEKRTANPAELCSSFGYGCGSSAPMSEATKTQVADILKGILSNLGSHK